MKPKIATLCGSTRFKGEFEKANKYLTSIGVIVLSVGWFGHCETDGIPDDIKVTVDELHLRKIDVSDYIFVINVGGYIGESTRKEIEYAKSKNIPVYYMEDVQK